MTSVEKTLETETVVETRNIWVKPEIASFEPVSATQAATINPGDALSSNS
ncbi:hypothetical protein OF829_13455 [Sphingomonas sp. LB-2]|nr:hypothetical protein [Sphingomonas caeni]MCW3848247.1 hypothetical protein [Sphingomonas caeni]